MEKHYDEAEVLSASKSYPIRRTTEDYKRVRDWAIENGISVAKSGPVHERVIMQWIDSHAGMPNPVIRAKSIYDEEYTGRAIDVICYKCAMTHHHSGHPGERWATENNHREAHCQNAYEPSAGYYIEDNLPIAAWEIEAKALNESRRA